MKTTLAVTLDDKPGALGYELVGGEELVVSTDTSSASLYLNRAGCEALAKILAKMALGGYEAGFHVHLKEDFGEEPGTDVLTVVLR